MNNLSKRLRRTSLVVGLVVVAILGYIAPAGAGEDGTTSFTNRSRFYLQSDLKENHSRDASLFGGTGLTIPLTGSLSLDLSLSSVDTGQAATSVKPFGAPPIPVTKPDESDLRSYRLGAGFSFRF